MNRLPSFDAAATKRRLGILKVLHKKELSLGEIALLLNETNRSKVFYHLKILKGCGLIVEKRALKNCMTTKDKNIEIRHWLLSSEGQQALAYFCGEVYLK